LSSKNEISIVLQWRVRVFKKYSGKGGCVEYCSLFWNDGFNQYNFMKNFKQFEIEMGAGGYIQNIQGLNCT